MQINNTFFTVRLGAAAICLLSLLVAPNTYLHGAASSKKASNVSKLTVPPSNNTTISDCGTTGKSTTDDTINEINNNINEINNNLKAVRTDSRLSSTVVLALILSIINIGISIFLYFLLQNKLQELIESILSIMRIDEANKKLTEKLNNAILQMRKDCLEKCSQQEFSLNELRKSIDKIAQLKTAPPTTNIPTPIQTLPPVGNSSHEIEQWKEWEQKILTEYRNLMNGARTPEEIKQFRKRYDILDIKRGSQGTFAEADKDSFLWAMKKPNNQEYLVIPSDKFYNDLSGFYANDRFLTHDIFRDVMELVPPTDTTSEILIKPGVVILKEDVFTISQRGELGI